MDRREFLTTSAAALVATSLPMAPARSEATRDSVNIAIALEPPGLDATMQPANAVGEVTLRNIYECLTGMDETGKIQPLLAESWESPDSRDYRFKLVTNAKFHDGSPFTSADVKFTFERNAGEKSTNKRKRIFVNMESIDTPDPYTLVIKLKQPSRLLPTYLAEATGSIVSAKTADANATTPVGTGPYKFTSWVRGDSVSFEKFADYRDAAKVQMRSAKMRFMSDANAQLNALLSGEIDFIPRFQALESLERLKDDARFVTTIGGSSEVAFVGINNKKAPFTDVRVRRAITHAIDRKSVIDGVLNGYGRPIGTHMTPLYSYYLDLTGQYPFDPPRARALLAEAGFPGGLDLTLKVPPSTTYERTGEVVVAMLAEAGMRAKIETMEWAQWLDVVFRQKAYDLTVISQPEPWTIFNYTDPKYFYQYDKAAYNELCRKAEASTSEEEFADSVHGALHMLTDDAASAWLFEMPRINVVRKGLAGAWVQAPMAVYDVAAMRWQAA